MTEIYTIFGDSTWPKSGVIADRATPYSNAVLVWEDALKVLTTQCVGDVARSRMKIQGYDTEGGNVNSPNIMGCMTFGQYLFSSYKPNAWVPIAPNSEQGTWIGNYVQWGSPNRMKLSQLLSDMRTNHNAEVICAESSYSLAALPRICGSSYLLECYSYIAHSNTSNENHGYNVLNNRVYDATSYLRDEDESPTREADIPQEIHTGAKVDTNPNWDNQTQTGRQHTTQILIY